MFDPNTFLDMTVQESNSTVTTPVPIGEFIAVIEDVKAREWKKKDDPSVAGMALDVVWNIDDANVKQLLERDKVAIKQGIMLDLTPEGGLDMGKGKNVGLGRLREALDLNQAKVKVTHRIEQKPGEEAKIYAEVGAVAKIA
jgi:hypothetical protein